MSVIMVSSALAGELDGKSAICNFPAAPGMKETTKFLKFVGENIFVYQVVEESYDSSEYGFTYNEVRLNETVDKVYVTPAFAFWSSFIGDNVEEAASPDEATTSVLMGVDGIWNKIDRYTLDAEIGIQLKGTNLHQTGECEMAGDIEDSSFWVEYQKMKNAADEENMKKTDEAKKKKKKL